MDIDLLVKRSRIVSRIRSFFDLLGFVEVAMLLRAVEMGLAGICIGAFDKEAVKAALASFEGVKRRMEVYLNTPELVYIDDYAHHPEELRATIESLRGIFPGRRLLAIFQPHLYTRTRDFAAEFSEVLTLCDEVIMVPIYPARELPIEGVCSEMIGRNLKVEWQLVEREALAERLRDMETDVVVTFGAGNIDAYSEAIAAELEKKA